MWAGGGGEKVGGERGGAGLKNIEARLGREASTRHATRMALWGVMRPFWPEAKQWGLLKAPLSQHFGSLALDHSQVLEVEGGGKGFAGHCFCAYVQRGWTFLICWAVLWPRPFT